MRPTIIATRNFFPTNLHLPKTLLSALVLSPPLGWWDISAKSTQPALYLKKGFLRRVWKSFWVLGEGGGGFWRLLGRGELRHDEGHRVGGNSAGRSFNPENGRQFSSQLSLDRHSSLDCLTAVQASPWINAGFCGRREDGRFRRTGEEGR